MSSLSLDTRQTVVSRVSGALAIVLLLCLAPDTHASGATITAASCSYAVVSAVLVSAPEGSTVLIPAGDCTWEHDPIQRYGGVTLKGAVVGSTIIRAALVTGSSDTSNLLTFNCWSNTSPIEISNISFMGNESSPGYNDGVTLQNGCQNFKIHDNLFQNFKGEALDIKGPNGAGADYLGVVYDNRFIGNLESGSGYGVDVGGASHLRNLELGDQDPNAVFIEDNYFESNRHSIAANYGARYVARHNTFVTTALNWTSTVIDAHGIQDATYTYGTRSWEVYDNTLSISGQPPAGTTTGAAAIKMRGGDGLIYNNVIDGGFAYSVVLRLEWHLNGDEQCADSNGNPTNGTVPGIAGPYPATFLGQTRQAWIWGNTWGSASQVLQFDGCEFYFHENRDYVQQAPTQLELGYVYQPIPYPHPLRGVSDIIFSQGSNSVGGYLCPLPLI